MLFLFQALNEICVESEVYPEEEEEETGGGSLLRYSIMCLSMCSDVLKTSKILF